MTESHFHSLQAKLDTIVAKYLDEHPHFIVTARDKDAALKGKSDDDVKAMLKFYPGVIAVAVNKVAHELNNGNAAQKIQARELAEAAHTRSGIDIHPGTTIGEECFIDHGTGVVIGETAKIGRNTLLYHGVTLGAYGNPEESDPSKLAHRHPEIGDNCTISVGAQVLGNVKIGNNVVISPNATLFGNHLSIGNRVSIGTGVQIGDGNAISDNIRIGAGAVIPKGVGAIDQNIPAYTHVSRSPEGKLEFGVTIPTPLARRVVASQHQETGEFSYTI